MHVRLAPAISVGRCARLSRPWRGTEGLPTSRSPITTKEHDITPRNRVTAYPGEILQEDFLTPLGVTANPLATAVRVPAHRIGAILRGERAITADTALRLARYFQTSAEFWLNLQTMHDLTKTAKELRQQIERDVQPRAA
jgi:addiction module HigA family antidote